MSTKTLRKRIALVAVSAMGFGLLSTAPSSAVVTAIAVKAPVVSRAGSSAIVLSITNTGTIAAAATESYKAKATTVPTGSGIELGDIFAKDITAGIATTGALSITTLSIGRNYTVAAGPTGTELPTAGTDTCALNAATDVAAVIGDGLGAIAGTNVGDTPTGTGDLDVVPNGRSGSETLCSITDDFATVAGSYSFFVWNDANNDNLVSAGEVSSTVTFLVGGAPTNVTITPTVTSQGTALPVGLQVQITDASARPTLLAGTETVVLTKTVLSGVGTLAFSGFADALGVTAAAVVDGATVTLDLTDLNTSGQTFIRVDIAHSAAGTFRVTANLAGSLDPLATAASTGTVTTNAILGAKTLSITTAGLTKNAVVFSAPTALNALNLTQTVQVNSITTAAIAFKLTGTAGSQVAVTLGGIAGALSLTAGTSIVTLDAAGEGTYTVSPTSVTAGTTTYTVTVANATAGNMVYTVNYVAPAIDCTAATTCSISTTGIPAGVTKDVTAAGAAHPFTVTVKDQFGTAYSNYVVMLTTGSTDRNASKSITATTNSSGQATVSYTDASTSTTVLSDVVNLKVFAPSNLVADLFDFNDVITIKHTGALGSLALAGGSTTTTVVKRTVVNIDAVNTAADTTSTDRVRTITDTLKDVNLVDAVTGYAVTYTATPGALFLLAGEDYTDAVATITVANGTAVFVVSEKPGVQTITATAGGLTKTATVTFVQGAGTERNVTVSVPATGKTGITSAGTATVTDGFGNPVSGVSVTFLRSGGRFISGASTVSVLTDSAGVASADYTAEVAGSVTITAKIATGGALSLEDDPVTGFADAIASASAATVFAANTATEDLAAVNAAANKALLDVIAALTAKIAADKIETDLKIAAVQAASVAAAEAAADAAAEAIDAGNNAFDAATSAGEAADAATAAAEQAGEDATAAANAAGEAAVAAAEAAQEAAAEATDAANAATDAANASAEAADAATAAAQDAADAVAALSTQVSEMISALKKQITALTNLVIKIQKKVRA